MAQERSPQLFMDAAWDVAEEGSNPCAAGPPSAAAGQLPALSPLGSLASPRRAADERMLPLQVYGQNSLARLYGLYNCAQRGLHGAHGRQRGVCRERRAAGISASR